MVPLGQQYRARLGLSASSRGPEKLDLKIGLVIRGKFQTDKLRAGAIISVARVVDHRGRSEARYGDRYRPKDVLLQQNLEFFTACCPS